MLNNVVYMLENQVVQIEGELKDGYVFGHFAGDVERRFMAPLSDLRLSNTANTQSAENQASHKQTANKPQASHKEATSKPQASHSQTDNKPQAEIAAIAAIAEKMRRVQSFIPEKLLIQVIEERWPVMAYFERPEIYKFTSFQNFEQLVAAVEKGEIKTCPKPIADAINDLITKNQTTDLKLAEFLFGVVATNPNKQAVKEGMSRDWYTKSIELFIQYRAQYYPPQWLIKFDQFLNKIDQFLNFLLKIA